MGYPVPQSESEVQHFVNVFLGPYMIGIVLQTFMMGILSKWISCFSAYRVLMYMYALLALQSWNYFIVSLHRILVLDHTSLTVS